MESKTTDSTELKFIHTLIRDGYKTAIDSGFKHRVIMSDTCKEYLNFIQQYHADYGVAPNLDRMRMKFPDIILPNVSSETVQSLLDDLNALYIDKVSKKAFTEAVRLLRDADNPEKKKEVVSEVRRLIAQYTTDIEDVSDTSEVVDVTEDDFGDNYLTLLDHRAEKKGLQGIPYLWDSITDYTTGIGETHFVVLLARPKVGKTFILTAQAAYSSQWIEDHFDEFKDKGKTDVVFISNEITTEEAIDRYVASSVGISYSRVRKGLLNDTEKHALKSALSQWKNRRSKFKVIGTEGMGIGGVNLVEAILVKHKPAILYIDGAYLLTDETKNSSKVYENMAGVARRLKKLTKQYRTPIFITWQFNRSVKDGGEGGYGNSAGTDVLAQDCDVFLSLSATPDQMEFKQRKISSPGSRACMPFTIITNFDLEVGDYSELSPDEQETYEGDF